MKFTDINLKAVFPAYIGQKVVVICSFLFVIILYLVGIKAAADRVQKRNLHLLFWLSFSSSLFLALLCIKAHHYTALYHRYFSFSLPFCSLYAAYLIYVFWNNNTINKIFTGTLALMLAGPAILLFGLSLKSAHPAVKYNHIAIARTIIEKNIQKIALPEWRDAFLINCFLPADYKIDYFRNPATDSFTLYEGGIEEKIQVVRTDN